MMMTEKKTLGSFLAALRKAKGLTQKDLAEQLNVSDKSVSRWERDEGLPDLSLIPVLAEIFGVTSDELLRGERQPLAGADVDSGKSEKQRRRILAASLARCKSHSYLAGGLATVGLLAAWLCNSAFNRAYLGFFLGAACCLAAVIWQLIAVNSALLAVSDEEYAGLERGVYKRRVIRLAERVWGLGWVFFAALLPLPLWGGAYLGISGTWQYILAFGVVALLLWGAALHFINRALFQREDYAVSAEETAIFRRNQRLRGRLAWLWLALLLVNLLAVGVATRGWDVLRCAEGTEFADFDSFREFMEQDIPLTYSTYSYSALDSALAPVPESVAGEQHYYNEQGQEISQDEALTQTVTDSEGRVLCTFVHRNQSVQNWRTGRSDQGYLPVTAVSYDQFWAAQAKINAWNTLFLLLSLAETLAVPLLYLGRRAR